MFKSQVQFKGVIEDINYDTRDLKVRVNWDGDGEETIETVHMWKTDRDGSDPAWQGRPEWRDVLEVGMTRTFVGHFGNNGRIIAVGYPDDWLGLYPNQALVYGEFNDDNTIITATPRGRRVVVSCLNPNPNTSETEDFGVMKVAKGKVKEGKFVIGQIFDLPPTAPPTATELS